MIEWKYPKNAIYHFRVFTLYAHTENPNQHVVAGSSVTHLSVIALLCSHFASAAPGSSLSSMALYVVIFLSVSICVSMCLSFSTRPFRIAEPAPS